MTRNLDFEGAERDASLALLRKYRANLISRGKVIARELAKKNGEVTSPEVLEILKQESPNEVAAVDARFMGPVFVSDEWERIRFANKGSHKQPISVWRLRSEVSKVDTHEN